MNSPTPKTTLPTRREEIVDNGKQKVRLRTFPPPEEASLQTLISARGLEKSYRKSKVSVPVLRGVDFDAQEGKITAIVARVDRVKARYCICSVRSILPMRERSTFMVNASTISPEASGIRFAIISWV